MQSSRVYLYFYWKKIPKYPDFNERSCLPPPQVWNIQLSVKTLQDNQCHFSWNSNKMCTPEWWNWGHTKCHMWFLLLRFHNSLLFFFAVLHFLIGSEPQKWLHLPKRISFTELQSAEQSHMFMHVSCTCCNTSYQLLCVIDHSVKLNMFTIADSVTVTFDDVAWKVFLLAYIDIRAVLEVCTGATETFF